MEIDSSSPVYERLCQLVILSRVKNPPLLHRLTFIDIETQKKSFKQQKKKLRRKKSIRM